MLFYNISTIVNSKKCGNTILNVLNIWRDSKMQRSERAPHLWRPYIYCPAYYYVLCCSYR